MRSTHVLLVALAILVLVVSAACGGQKKPAPAPGAGQQTPRTETEQPGEPADIGEPATMEGEGEGKTVTLSDGGTTITAGESLPEAWPADVPIMEGFTIMGAWSTEDEGEGEIGMSVGAEGDVPIADVEEFYSALPGWERAPKLMITGGEGEMVNFTLTKDETALTVNAVRQEGETILTLAYLPNQ